MSQGEKNFKQTLNSLKSLGFELLQEDKVLKYEGPKAKIIVPIKQVMENPNGAHEAIVGKLAEEKGIAREK